MPVTLRLELFDRQSCYYYNNGPLKLVADRELHPSLTLFRRVLSCVSYSAFLTMKSSCSVTLRGLSVIGRMLCF